MKNRTRTIALLFGLGALGAALIVGRPQQIDGPPGAVTPTPAREPFRFSAETLEFAQAVPTPVPTAESYPGVAPFLKHQFVTRTPAAKDLLLKLAMTAAAVTPTRLPRVASISPELDALQELQRTQQGETAQPQGAASGRIFGARSRRGGNEVATDVTPEPTVTPTPTPTSSRLTGPAIGYTMLYLMHPRARTTVERQVDAMLRADINDLYLGVLVDGTFNVDFPYLQRIIRRLNVDGRKLTLSLYLTNGATMRAWPIARSRWNGWTVWSPAAADARSACAMSVTAAC